MKLAIMLISPYPSSSESLNDPVSYAYLHLLLVSYTLKESVFAGGHANGAFQVSQW